MYVVLEKIPVWAGNFGLFQPSLSSLMATRQVGLNSTGQVREAPNRSPSSLTTGGAACMAVEGVGGGGTSHLQPGKLAQ